MPSNNDIDAWNSNINKSIYADHLGLTPQFVKENEDRLKKIEKTVQDSLKSSLEDDPNRVMNTMKQLQAINRATFVSDQYSTKLEGPSLYSNPLGDGYQTRDGFKMIYGENENREDVEIFNFHSSVFANYRNLVSEYRNIARLIDEVTRVADMKARDILSINEITKKAVSNIYIPGSDTDNYEVNDEVLYKNPINKEIENEILDRYKVEEKLHRYFRISFIEGARPVAVFPFADIIDMANSNIDRYRTKYSDFNMKSQQGTESLVQAMVDCHNRDNSLVRDLNDPNLHIYGTESLEDGTRVQTFSQENYSKYRDSVINKFISQEDLNEYFSRGMEDINEKISKAENDEIFNIYGSNAIDKVEKVNETKERYRDLHGKVKIDGSLSEHFKNQIFNAIRKIDANVDFYDQSEIAIGSAINNIRRLMKFTGGYHDDPKYGTIAYGATKRDSDDLEKKIPMYTTDPLSKFSDDPNVKTHKSVLDEFDEFSQDSKSLLKDCLIKEYDAEDVIPIIVSGKHVGYYAIEMAPYTGNVESINKRNCNFTDIFINLGFENDSTLSPSPITSGSFSAGVNNVPVGGVGPVSDVPGLGAIGAGNLTMSAGLDISGFDSTPLSDDATHRNNIMKKIIFSVLKQKIKRNDLEDDETFVDTIMSLIRDGAIVQSKTKIIYIPEKYMCYFTPGLDGNGIPQSFLKDCLCTCYEKIAVNFNNIMTRLTRTGTKDKITINIGKAKSMGRSIRSIENALTTRQLNVESPFTSLSRVLKASSLSETIIVPVFEGGEKLFEYEELANKNEVQPNDDLEQRLSNQIVTSLKAPITITNPYQEEDFASLAASRNAEYRFDIILHQKKFAPIAEKFIKLLIVGSGLYQKLRENNIDSDQKFSLKQIHVNFSPPEALNLQHSNDLFGTVSSYVDNIIGVVFDSNDDTESNNWKKFEFKKALYQKLMPSLGLDEYLDMVSKITPESMNQSIKKRIDRSVNDQIVNTDFKPLLVDKDGKVVENNMSAGSGGDSGGGDDFGF